MFKKLSKSRFIRNSIFVLALILSIGATSIFGAKNSMIKVGKNEVVAIKSSLIENKDLLFVEVDAHNWAKDEDFFEDIGKKMEFPRSLWNHESWCLDEFEDLMRDLVWTENKSIVMIINNFFKSVKYSVNFFLSSPTTTTKSRFLGVHKQVMLLKTISQSVQSLSHI